jgi:toxin secretion/phage lysis holin
MKDNANHSFQKMRFFSDTCFCIDRIVNQFKCLLFAWKRQVFNRTEDTGIKTARKEKNLFHKHFYMSFEVASWFWIVNTVLFQNFFSKFLVAVSLWIGEYLVGDIFFPNQKLFLLMFLLYIINFSTWVLKAILSKNFSSARFFRGAIKLGVYCTLVLIWHSIDQIIVEVVGVWNLITSAMFWFILTTESSSILENFHDLGFNTPVYFQKFLKSYSTKLWREKISKIDPDFAKDFEDYTDDFSELVNVYVPKIKCLDFQKLLKIKFEHWWLLCDKVQQMKVSDIEIFKQKFLLMVKETVKDIEASWWKAWIDAKTIDSFMKIHQLKVDRFFTTIDKMTEQQEWTDFEVRKMVILKELSLLNYQALNEVLNDPACQ